jgi:hypothetical protein
MKKAVETITTGIAFRASIIGLCTLSSIIFYDMRDDVKYIRSKQETDIREVKNEIKEIKKIYLTKADHVTLKHPGQ